MIVTEAHFLSRVLGTHGGLLNSLFIHVIASISKSVQVQGTLVDHLLVCQLLLTCIDKEMVWVNYNASAVLIRLVLGALNSLPLTSVLFKLDSL